MTITCHDSEHTWLIPGRHTVFACPADGQLAGLVQYLQKRLRTLEGENTSLEQVVSRLKIDAEAATRRASQAEQARLETAEQLRSSLRTKEQHEHQMQQVQEVNLLRESNVTLRLLQRPSSNMLSASKNVSA